MSVELRGLNATNPVGFLAALGTLALAADALGDEVLLGWRERTPNWTPVMVSPHDLDRESLVNAVVEAHERRDLDAELGWEADVMTLSRDAVRDLLSQRLSDDQDDAAAMVAACAAELPLRRGPEDRVAYTPFRLIPRVGRARFLATAHALSEAHGNHERVAHALFEPWRYEKGNNLRWDPGATIPARAYTAEAPTHFGPLAVPGAMLLAVAGLRFFPLLLAHGQGACRGFGYARDRLVWPIWRDPLSQRATRILLGLPELHADDPDHAMLDRHGVVARLVATRERLGGDVEMLSWGNPVGLDEDLASR